MSPAALAERWPLVGRRPELAAFHAAVNSDEFNAFVVHGAPGVGKTRLADECLRLAERAGYSCGRAVATADAGTIPLAAIAHLLPADIGVTSGGQTIRSVELFSRARRALEAAGNGLRFVLMVDDLHYLDVTSATLVRQLVTAGAVFLVGTVLNGRRATTSVTAIWRDDRCRRVDLDELPRDSVETLLYHALGAPVDGPAAHSLWSTSRGNVLFLRELVLGAEQSGALVDEGGVWRLARSLTSTPRLDELVAARVASVSDDGLRALEVLALCGPLGADAFAGIVEPHVLEALEEAGLVGVSVDGRRRQLRVAHPVHGDVLRGRTPELRRRATLLREAEALERRGARRREDPLRIAAWRLDAAGEADAALLVQAARLAHDAHDYPLAVRLAAAAQVQQPGSEAGLLLGRGLYELGSFFEADVELSRAGRLADGDEHRVAVAAARAANLVWGLLRPDDALALNRAARETAASDEARDELVAQEAWIMVFAGAPARARALVECIPHAAGLRTGVIRALAESYALTFQGLPAAAVDLARQGHRSHLQLGDRLWLDQPASHVLALVAALTDCGRLEEASERASAGYREASEQQVPLLQIRFAFHCGRIALLSGRPRTAKRWFREAVARSEAVGFDGPRGLGLAGLAVAHAWLGDAEGAGTAVMGMDEVRNFGFLRPERELGRAWWLAASGDLGGARGVLADAARIAMASGHVTAASWLLHDVARLGRPAEVADRLDKLATGTDSELVAARAAHVRALQSSDPDGLEQAADRFEAMGALLAAAEAAGAASRAAARQGFARRSSALAVRAFTFAGQCEGARTPGLLESDGAVALTPREREVAVMAAAGVASKDIAARLFLSVRTVNNHLQRVYDKLGVSGREELRASLDAGSRADSA